VRNRRPGGGLIRVSGGGKGRGVWGIYRGETRVKTATKTAENRGDLGPFYLQRACRSRSPGGR
jgi:hypothetical protein